MTNTAPLAFGTMQFGGRADPAASRAMFDACIDAGITHFDTAFGYNDGASETLLGQFAAPLRDRLFIATKAGFHGGGGRANLTRQFDASRKRLNMDLVDLLYLHRFHPDSPLHETFETFADFKQRGLIRQIGLSNFAAWQVMKAQAVAASFGLKVDALQPMYNLVKRQAEVEILPMAADQGIRIYSYSPLGGGLLSGKYGADISAAAAGRLSWDKAYSARYAPPQMHLAAEGLSRLAALWGHHPATLAVAFVMAHPTRPTPLISARDTAQLAPSLAALSLRLTADQLSQIAALSPAPPPATDRLEEA